MMIWLKAAVLAVCFLMSLIGHAVNATEGWGEPVISSALSFTPDKLTTCHGMFRPVVVEGIGTVEGCYVSGKLRAVMYRTAEGPLLAVSKSPMGMLYPVKGVCEQNYGCEYAAGSDRIIERLFAAPGKFIVRVHDTVSRFMSIHSDDQLGTHVYRLSTERAWTVVGRDGVSVAVGAFAGSRNGQWLVVELSEKGIGLVNLEKRQVRRVMAPGYRYGRGMDPSEHLAVTNDGRAAVVTGQNAGFSIISVDEGCGDTAQDTMSDDFESGVRRCLVSNADIGSTVQGFREAYAPQFLSDTRLSVIVHGQGSGYRLVSFNPASVPSRQPLEYLALGDSFTSGEGELDDAFYLPMTNTFNERCHTSQRSYPFVAIPGESTRNIACSGATIQDVVNQQEYRGQQDRLKNRDNIATLLLEAQRLFIPGRVPQSDFLQSYYPKYLTIGVGGNDAGMMDKLRACAMPTECQWVNDEGRQQTAAEIQRLHPELVGLYRSLQLQAPDTRMTVVGYPKIIGLSDKCDPVTRWLFSSSERKYMNESIQYLNRVIASAAAAAQVRYVDVEADFNGAALCDDNPEPAMNGFRFGRETGIVPSMPLFHFIGNETFHPTALGHALVGRKVGAALRSDDRCHPVCTASTSIPEPSTYWMPEGGPRPVPTLLRQEMVDLDAPGDTIRRVKSMPFMFASESRVRIELYSKKVLIAEITTDNEGAIDYTFALPPGLEEGFHTLYVYGELDSGESVGYYQVIAYTTSTELAGIAPAQQGSSQKTSPTSFSLQEAETVPQVLAATTSSTQEIDQINDAKKTSSLQIIPMEWFWIIPVLLLIGIMAVWLLFARQ